MAGVTREVRVAAERLPDRISIGVLARTFTPALLDEVIDAAKARQVRYRRLPARLVMLFTLTCWLFTRSGYSLVMSRMADAHASTGPGWGDWHTPTSGALARARVRLGVEPLRLLFARVAGPVGTAATPGVFWRGLRVCAVDGLTLDVPDTAVNAEFFGRGANGSTTPNPYPQLRALVLAECGTRSLLGGVHGPSTTGEQTLAEDLLTAFTEDMIVLSDRNFASWKLWGKAVATGAALCWRMTASFKLPVLEVLADGTYISELKPPRKKDGPPIRVRVIEYSVATTDTEDATTTSECFTLATTLLDPATAPAMELAELYHERWQAETTIGEMKTEQRGGPEMVLRSKTPDMVAQEFWAMLCVYQGIRELIANAARPARLDPRRVSFKRAVEASRDAVPQGALSPRGDSSAP